MALQRLQRPLGVLQAGLASVMQRGFAAQPEREARLPQMPPFDHKPAPYTGPSKEEVRRGARRAVCSDVRIAR